MPFQFDNTYRRLPSQFYSECSPACAPNPELLTWNEKLAKDLGIDSSFSRVDLLRFFSGQQLPHGAEPIAQAYSGHQFAYFTTLGDGRALLLGEVLDRHQKRFDIQLKGAGKTPYSRGGDGYSALGPVLREYLLSEAMHCLGVPTTRALAALRTGQDLQRTERLPGGILVRVAQSHIRVGTFEHFYARGDRHSLQTLLDYTIERHYPQLVSSENQVLDFLREVIRGQAQLLSQWMSLGFIHGVMNTDNMSIAGLTLDYGPCAFMDQFNFKQVYSYIDRRGRYAYNQQLAVAQWNLTRLAESLMPLIDSQPKKASELLQKELQSQENVFEKEWLKQMALKFGLSDEHEELFELVLSYLKYLQDHQLDYTNSFRELADSLERNEFSFFSEKKNDFLKVLSLWEKCRKKEKLDNRDVVHRMNQVNPLYIPRNHLVEEALVASLEGDQGPFDQLHQVLSRPFEKQLVDSKFSQAPRPDQVVQNTFCGT